MNEIDFRNWLFNKNTKPKVISDIISRIKRIEHELVDRDIDEQYQIDKCMNLLKLFQSRKNTHIDEEKHHINLQNSKLHVNTHKYALKKYINFCEETLK